MTDRTRRTLEAKTEGARVWGARIKHAREERGWTQRELADRIGVSRVTIAAYEAGNIIPRPKKLPRLENALGLASSVADLETPAVSATSPKETDRAPAGRSPLKRAAIEDWWTSQLPGLHQQGLRYPRADRVRDILVDLTNMVARAGDFRVSDLTDEEIRKLWAGSLPSLVVAVGTHAVPDVADAS